jgi:threonyl-tRNA synthetase
VLDLHPGTKISIGPAIEGGFYYDFEFPEGVTVTDADFAALEERMRAHVKADEPFVREDVTVAEALERFRAEDQPYKVELIEDLVRDRGVETVSLYTNGPFTDLCRGPHAPSTKRIKAFTLQSVAGAYWRGGREPHAADAVLRHGVLLEGGPRRHLRASRRPRARPPPLGPQLGLFTFSEVSPG